MIDSSVPEDPSTKAVVQTFLGVLGAEMDKKIGHSNVDLDARFSKVRTQETNVGNFVADVMRRGTSAEVAILNSGTLRADCIIPAGDLVMKDMVSILPMVDETCVIEMTGVQLVKALENGVSQYPRLEGRFPQVSGVEFTFDAAQDPGSRVVRDSVKVSGSPLADDQTVSVVTKAYLAKGKDGFDVFAQCKVLVDEENAPILPTLVRNTFTELSVLNGFKMNTPKKVILKVRHRCKFATVGFLVMLTLVNFHFAERCQVEAQDVPHDAQEGLRHELEARDPDADSGQGRGGGSRDRRKPRSLLRHFAGDRGTHKVPQPCAYQLSLKLRKKPQMVCVLFCLNPLNIPKLSKRQAPHRRSLYRPDRLLILLPPPPPRLHEEHVRRHQGVEPVHRHPRSANRGAVQGGEGG